MPQIPPFARLGDSLPELKLKWPDAFHGNDPGFHESNLKAGLMALPESTDQLVRLLVYCNAERISVVPQGGRTGLSGAAATRVDELIVDTSLMKKVIDIDPLGSTATVECGVTLQALEEQVNALGLTCGIDLAARGTATIGGMVATNAGGIEAFRNGIMRQRVLGLEAVLADGRILSDLKKVTKANEGFDLKQLFIGSEGTLGIITRVVLALLPLPASSTTALVSCESAAKAVLLFNRLRQLPGIRLLSAEAMWPDYANTVAVQTGLEHVLQFDQDPGDILVLLEIENGPDNDSTPTETSLEIAIEEEWISSAILAKNERERQAIWRIREDSFVIDDVCPHGLWFDFTVPLGSIDKYVDNLFRRIREVSTEIRVFLFAHLGDGNFHATLSTGEPLGGLVEPIYRAVYEGLNEIGGSFSAEHGIGLEKRQALQTYVPQTSVELMNGIKNLFDANGIMNPGKVL